MNERIDPFTVKKVKYLLDGYIALKVPGYVRSDVRLIYQIEDNCLILTEERPSNETESWDRTDIVQFRWKKIIGMYMPGKRLKAGSALKRLHLIRALKNSSNR